MSSSDINIENPDLVSLCKWPIGWRFELIQKVYFKVHEKIIWEIILSSAVRILFIVKYLQLE